jgi:predicted RNA polymerase sigma factor
MYGVHVDQLGELKVRYGVLYLVFNEGSTASAGDQVSRPDLSGEAIRLTRQLHRQVDHGEVAGLLALMLLTDARRPARTDSAGDAVALAEQDRRLWRTDAIAEGTRILRTALARYRIGPLQLQAAIAALHCEAASTAATDWPADPCAVRPSAGAGPEPHGFAEPGRGGGP